MVQKFDSFFRRFEYTKIPFWDKLTFTPGLYSCLEGLPNENSDSSYTEILRMLVLHNSPTEVTHPTGSEWTTEQNNGFAKGTVFSLGYL